MEREELKQVYAYASILWDTFKPPTDKAKAVLQAQIWFDFLRGYDLQVIFASMRELCKVSDFCNIGKVAKGCQTICNLSKNELDEDKIFREIDGAISWYNQDENFNKLSEMAKKVVGTPSQLAQWALSDVTKYNTVIASNIKRSIRKQLDEQKARESVGEQVLAKIEMIEKSKETKALLKGEQHE